jgi:two-component system alkaline phosphatase synthesis response regulator PhoP
MNNDFLIFIIEDDEDIAEIIQDNLKREGYKVTALADGGKAYDAIVHSNPDLIILDLNLPGISGIELCKYIRSNEATADTPVIMLTARSEEIDKIIGFEVGADDYVTKPFSPRELLARVKAHLKRAKKSKYETFTQNELKVNFATHEVHLNSQPMELTPIQFKLLKAFIDAKGKVLSRQVLLDTIWGDEYVGDARTVDVHITRLREKIDKQGQFIKTVKGAGYRWKFDE